MSEVRFVKLRMLSAAKKNVRRVKDERSIEELAASIDQHGLISPLLVRERGPDDYEVIAGNRRLFALQKVRHDETDVPVHVVPDDWTAKDIEEVQLAENFVRKDMHPVEIATTIRRLIKAGAKPADIAARFGRGEPWVIKLAALAELHSAVHESWLAGKIRQGHAEVLTLAPKAEQKELLSIAEAGWEPTSIRGRILKEAVPAKLAAFDLAKYPQKSIRADLFGEEAYLTDRAAFDRLQAEAIEERAQALRDDGWPTVETSLSYAWKLFDGWTEMEPESWPEAVAVKLAALEQDMERLRKRESEIEEVDEDNEDVWSKLQDEIADVEQAVEELQEKHRHEASFTAEQKARGRVVVLLRNAAVETHFLERIKTVSIERAIERVAEAEAKGEEVEPEVEGKKTADDLDWRQAQILASHHAIAAREAAIHNHEPALALLAHQLHRMFGAFDLHIKTNHGAIDNEPADLPIGQSMRANDCWERHERGFESDQAWSRTEILQAGPTFQMQLLASAVARWLSPDVRAAKQGEAADWLMRQTGTTIRQYWTPDAAFLGLYRKDQLLDLLERFVGPTATTGFDKRKKTELVELLAQGFKCAACGDRWKPITEEHWPDVARQLNSWLPAGWGPVQAEEEESPALAAE